MLLKHALIYLITLSLAGIGEARVFRVPTTETPTIQAGLDSLQNGDTVLVAVGIYEEALMAPPLSFVLKGDVISDSGDYPRPTIDPSSIPGSDSLAALILPAGSLPVLEDIRIANGPAMYPRRGSLDVGGIISSSTQPTLRRCILDSVYIGLSQELDQDGVTMVMESCVFRKCGYFSVNSVWSRIVATDCVFSGTMGYSDLRGGSNSRIVRCHFAQSELSHFLKLGGSGHLVQDCIFGPTNSSFFTALTAVSHFTGDIRDNLFIGCRTLWTAAMIETETPNGFNFSGNTFAACSTISPYQAGALQFGPDWESGDTIRSGTISGNIFVGCLGGTDYANDVYVSGVVSHPVGASLKDNRFCPAIGAAMTIPAVKSQGATTTFRENLFNGTGIAMVGDAMTDASWNWWGDSTGPYHATRNPMGQGGEVQGDLAFEPWYSDTSFLMDVFEHGAPLPKEYSLEAYPNPFNSQVRVQLIVPDVSIYRLELFDILGRRVKELWSGPVLYSKTIIADGSELASGTYIIRATETLYNRPVATTKIMLVK